MVNKHGMGFRAHLITTAAQDNGTPIYRIVMTDISERRRSEEELQKVHAEAQNEKLRLEAVMDVLPTGVAITDILGGTVQSNKEFERIWGGLRPVTRTVKDYEAFKAWWADTGKPVAPEEWASAQAVRKGRAVKGQILEIQRFDGSRAFVINSASPIHSVAGDLIGSAVTVHDITDLRAAQEALRMAELRTQKLNDALQEHVATVEAVNKELESYSHSVSHDLRTPLRFVNRIAHVLLHEPGAHLSEGAVQQVNMILRATSEMTTLIEKLLMFSQVSREPVIRRRVDMRRLFQEAVKELEHALEGRDVEIAIQDLAPCQCCRTLLKDVVINLLDNAIKFTRRRKKAQITIGCTETEGETVYSVQDNGAGFDMSGLDSLFVPFHRLHQPDVFEGTGIGLALVKRIIERHGGRIWAEGEVGKGAAFYFTVGKETEESCTTP
jgi:signal transduction histidine kinase